MLNFSVGPVQMNSTIRLQGSEQIPYFRTQEFSNVVFENEKFFAKFLDAPENSRTVFMTGSGTAGLECSCMNFFTAQDKVLVVNGGTFGHRLVELCTIFEIPHEELHLEYGQVLTQDMLNKYDGKGFTAMFLQHHETSTGILYDLNMVGSFCRKNGMFLCVDCISSFLADRISMKEFGINAVITGSQKGIALPPGMSFITMDQKGVDRINANTVKSMYFDLKAYLKDGERGQTPFTPAVSVILQLNTRLKQIEEEGGIQKAVEHTASVAKYFRDGIKDLPLTMFSKAPSNAVTSLTLNSRGNAYDVFLKIKDRYGIYICPNGGDLGKMIFRVGHIGYITKNDLDQLLKALHELNDKGEL